jgi:cyclophilin family peptidyl-prolyl cis-trans isomerase
MNKYSSIAVVLVLVVLGAWFIMNNKKTENINSPNTTQETQSQNTTNNNTNDTKNITNLDNSNVVKNMTTATINTNKGSITIEFFDTDAPNTVANFLKLAKAGFYDGIKFHRVIKGFMIQGGDPLTKDDSKMAMWGSGGPGYQFADEIDAKSALYKTGYKKGIVAMANSGPDTNGSQFFIMTEDYPLPSLYTIFGKVDSGQDVVDMIANVKTGTNDRPIDPVIISSINLK